MEFNLTTPKKDPRPVFITGNFNEWDPTDPRFRMQEIGPGKYRINIDDEILPKTIFYKFTKGGWSHVELNESNEIAGNRKTLKSTNGVVNDTVTKWRLNWGPFKEKFMPKVELISEAFYIPQLEKTRKIWALLPHDYYKTDKKYPVLYLQDAQNLFSDNAPFGNWELDKKLCVLSEYGRGDIIVIAVEHGGQDRISEYIFENPKLTEDAEGKKYVRFMADTLKPYVDMKYRTLKDRENTGIGGSSLGALISIYAGFLYPEVYSKLMLLSPSLWVEPKNHFPLLNTDVPFPMRVYVYGGLKESEDMEERINRFERALKRLQRQKLFDFDYRVSFNEKGTHNEFFWAEEFPKAVGWLFFESAEDPLEIIKRRYKSTSDANKK